MFEFMALAVGTTATIDAIRRDILYAEERYEETLDFEYREISSRLYDILLKVESRLRAEWL
jgi:hypothetical protein